MLRLRQFHILCCIGYTLLCLAWRSAAGSVWTWDFLHYHLYIAHAWWENRLPEELFAAGPQSYLNPLANLPFYITYQTGAHSLIVALSMALLHSINLWLLHFIACQLIPPTDRMHRLAVICSVVLGALSPAFLYEVGSSYADVIVSIPTLGALLLLLTWRSRPATTSPDWRLQYLAGLLAGIAMGLKPSSLVICAAMATALILLSGRQAWSVAWRAALAGTAGLTLAGGPHAWMLWKNFGNPVFPLFNGFFRSPWFPTVDVVSGRFRPSSLEAALRFPLDMANSFKRISFEEQVVDIRPVWLLGLAACTILVLLVRHSHSTRPSKAVPREKKLFWLCLALSIPAWIYSSGNIRYAIEPLLLLGPAIALLALHWVGKRYIWALLAIFLPLFGQTVLATTVNAWKLPGFNGKTWPSALFNISLPEPLHRTPTYYLSLQSLSLASLAPLFPSGSRFLNLIGGSTLPPDSIPLEAMEAYRQTNKLPLRTLYMDLNPAQHKNSNDDKQNSLLSEYGYKIDESDCVLIEWNNINSFSAENSRVTSSKASDVITSCAVIKADPLSPKEKTRRENIDARIDRWARRCPEVFSPLGFWSRQYPIARQRHFPSTDVQIVEKAGALRVAYSDTNMPMIDLEDKDGTPLITGCPPKPSK